MPTNAVAENVLGTFGEYSQLPVLINDVDSMRSQSASTGAVCWMIQLVPQVWKSWREKSTEGLSAYLG